MIQKIKNKLIKKFSLVKAKDDGKALVLEFSYQNFIYFSKSRVKLTINGSAIKGKVSKKNKKLQIKLQLSDVEKLMLNSSFNLKVIYGTKELWITSDDTDGQQLYQGIQVASNIYEVVVDRYLMFKNVQLDYPVNSEALPINIKTDGDAIVFSDLPEQLDSVMLVNASRQLTRPIENEVVIPLETIMTDWEDDTLYVMGYGGKASYRLVMPAVSTFEMSSATVLSVGSTLGIKIRQTAVQKIIIKESIDNSAIDVVIEDSRLTKKYKFSQLELSTLEGETVVIKNIKTINNRLIATLPLALLSNNQLQKTLIFTLINKKTNEVVKTRINSEQQNKFSKPLVIDDGLVDLYLLKKNGLIMMYRLPILKVGINQLNSDGLDIFFKPSPVYATGSYMLRFEERGSQDGIDIPIRFGEQVVPVDFKRLETIRTSPKNIIDIFVCIYEGDELVRKEKLRYRLPDYKKDNYIQKTEIISESHRMVYMFTLTPYKNLKIESFKLSNEEYEILNNGKKDNNVWLIGERTETAQDNGVSLFRWLRAHTTVEAYYVIDGEAKDFARVKDDKNVLVFGSKEHIEVAAKANVLISTHDLENILPYKTAKGFFGYEDTTKIFLQHGVLGRKNVEYHKRNYSLPFDLFNVSSQAEKDDIVIKEFGYQENDVAITGLSRFDNLPLVPKDEMKRILIMPTWRDFLNSDYAFMNSEYMKRYVSLINSPQLRALATKYGLEINFYPHFRAQEFFKNSLEEDSDFVNFVELGDRTVQELLIDHDVLITDYSSVSFDFSYMNKPVLFYHFDADRFFHKGILRPINETFIGPISHNEEDLIENLEKALNKTSTNVHLDGIFDHIDHQNNERVYQAIKEKVFK